MDIGSQISSAVGSANEWLGEQEWFQQIKAKWDELDAQSRTYLQFATVGLSAFLVCYLILSFIWGVSSLHKEVADKNEILLQLQSANEELRRYQAVNSTISAAIASAGASEPWGPYFDGIINQIGLAKASVTVSDPKTGSASDIAKEALYEIAVKKVNLHQMVRFAYALETGSRPLKLLNLVVNTVPDGSGYLDATLSVAAFTLVNNNPPNGK